MGLRRPPGEGVPPLLGGGSPTSSTLIYTKDLTLPITNDETAVLVLTDFMDSKSPCPVAAKMSYLGKKAADVSQNFLLRFAVNELESWLLADHTNFARLLGIRSEKISPTPGIPKSI